MAKLISESLCLSVTPRSFARVSDYGTGWKWYEFSVTVLREEGTEEKEMPLFNSDLLNNPFSERIDSNSISFVFGDALKTGKISHFRAFEEMNIYVSIYPSSVWDKLDLPNPLTEAFDEFMIIFQFQGNTFSHAGYGHSGPALVLYVNRQELEVFYKTLLEEEKESFAKSLP